MKLFLAYVILGIPFFLISSCYSNDSGITIEQYLQDQFSDLFNNDGPSFKGASLPFPGFISLASQITLTDHEQLLYNTYSFDELFKMGRFHKIKGDIENAMNYLKPALMKNPSQWDANWDLGDLYLIKGDFKRGFAGFRLRWFHDERYKEKLWLGENIRGKTILIYCQWGLGDTFMLIRYAQLIKRLGAKVIVYCQKPLKKILSYCNYIDKLICTDAEIPDFDYQVPITFLPELFQTTIETIPHNVPYLFVDEQIFHRWYEEIYNSLFRIGICWHGENRNDPQTTLRPIPLKKLIPLFKIPGVMIYSLQVGDGSDQIGSLPPYCKLYSFGPDFDKKDGAFVDTAAVMQSLDLVITVDTSLAHLAGGLGVPVWVLLPYANEWRYLLNRSDCPWYPTMKLFRQPQPGNWDAVVLQVTKTLSKLIKEHNETTV